jgi:hypothetical protein
LTITFSGFWSCHHHAFRHDRSLGRAVGIAYGILHDQVTARVCLEYFIIGHPPLIASESPTLLAIAWGIVATWWFALPLGFALAAAARFAIVALRMGCRLTGRIVIERDPSSTIRHPCRGAMGHDVTNRWRRSILAPLGSHSATG